MTWQPIATAMRDERQPILAYAPEGGFWDCPVYAVVYWVDFAQGWYTWPDAEYEVKPTHWMPLPAPPDV